ncbi:BcII family subclass B1 metallo-beta-lactamase [Fulvivirga kasyanovii]|uniref:beta-lactamase n=1 Tax=Fulvivirga kasyanovii TaxID=396812 RepID=A0ABW9RVP3_9BACT|nr:subclass B1 metallo-beta-lactamase [Fulvivirga kasyanovii]MTI28126.1 subclass B1 metallo-beta-lactamase [Fulvivirga kasyanovii]
MRILLATLLLTLFTINGYAQNEPYQIDVTKLDSGLYLYHSYAEYKGNKVSANGIVIEAGDSVVVIDSPWDNEQTIQLLDWVEAEIVKPVAAVVITHAHNDRIGGISVLHERNIKTVSSQLTKVYALKRGFEAPKKIFEKETTLNVGEVTVNVFYPGAGHTVDNTVVYISPYEVLYGGCFIKSSGAKDLGNIEDADLDSWGGSIKNMQRRFPAPKMVIPGHGNYTPGAIENTLKLLGYQ